MAWSHVVLNAIDELGGHIYLSELYDWIAAHVPLDPGQQKITFDNKPRYVHASRFAISNLKKAGLVKHLGPGEYELTDAGRASVEALSKNGTC